MYTTESDPQGKLQALDDYVNRRYILGKKKKKYHSCDADNGGGYACGEAGGIRKSLYLRLNFVTNVKLLLKK